MSPRESLNITPFVPAQTDSAAFKAIFESAAIGIAMFTLDGYLIDMNPFLLKLLGYTLDEIRKVGVVGISHPDDMVADKRLFDRLQSRTIQSYTLEKRYIQKSGAILWGRLTVSLVPSRPGQSEFIVAIVEDVTPRKEVQRIVEDRSARLAMALDVGEAMAWDWDLPSGKLDCHGDLAAFPKGAPANSEAWHQRIVDSDLPKFHAAIARAIADRSGYEVDYRLLGPSGETHWLRTKAQVTCDEFGKAVSIVGVTSDVTRHRNAEQVVEKAAADIRTSEERMRLAMSTANAASWDWIVGTDHVIFDEGAEKLFGRRIEGFDLQTWIDIIHPADRQRALDQIYNSIDLHTEFNSEYRILWPDGSIHWLVSRGTCVYDANSKPIRMVGMCLDITDRKKAEEELRKNQKQLRLVIDAIPSLISYVDCQEVFRFANRTYQGWMGLDVAVEGKTVREVLGDKAYDMIREYREAALAGKLVEYEQLIPFKYAGQRYVHCMYVPDVEETGNVRGYVAFVNDLTERRRTEEQLRRTEKLAATGRLAATIAHEINNPLEAVTNLLYLAKSDPTISDSGRDFLVRAEDELARVAHIARQTLGFYRDSVGPIHISVQEVLEDVLQLYSKKLIMNRIEVVRNYRAQRAITALAGEIRQVFSNLIGNAVDSMPNGGKIILRIRCAPTRVRNGEGVCVTIADTGTGIEPANLEKVFEPFFTTKRELGTGLGLWLTRNIVQKHGGLIGVRSRTGPRHRGTVFSVFLPEQFSAKPEESR